jgi:hypothetical protein
MLSTKLTLTKETLQSLDQTQTAHIAGGAYSFGVICNTQQNTLCVCLHSSPAICWVHG